MISWIVDSISFSVLTITSVSKAKYIWMCMNDSFAPFFEQEETYPNRARMTTGRMRTGILAQLDANGGQIVR